MEIMRIAPVLITTVALLAWQLLARRRAIKIETYRPERHYMRGPGPKYRAKHGL